MPDTASRGSNGWPGAKVNKHPQGSKVMKLYSRSREMPLTLYHVDDLTITFEDIDNLSSLLIPDKEVARVTAAHDIFVLKAKEVGVFDRFDIAMASIFASVRETGNAFLDSLPELPTSGARAQ